MSRQPGKSSPNQPNRGPITALGYWRRMTVILTTGPGWMMDLALADTHCCRGLRSLKDAEAYFGADNFTVSGLYNPKYGL